MANSRLERIGTIYNRITGLLRSEAMKPDNKPIWYEVYQRFPPKYSPRFDRPVPNVEIPQIFYPEDVIRAEVKKRIPSLINTVSLTDTNRLSNTQKCVLYFEELKEGGNLDENALQGAMDRVIAEGSIRKQEQAPSSIADEFKKSKNLVRDIFKE